MLFQIEEKKATLLVFVLFLRLRETMFQLATAITEVYHLVEETFLRVNVRKYTAPGGVVQVVIEFVMTEDKKEVQYKRDYSSLFLLLPCLSSNCTCDDILHLNVSFLN